MHHPTKTLQYEFRQGVNDRGKSKSEITGS